MSRTGAILQMEKKAMLYLFQALLPYVILSGVLGFVVGWFACGREDLR